MIGGRIKGSSEDLVSAMGQGIKVELEGIVKGIEN